MTWSPPETETLEDFTTDLEEAARKHLYFEIDSERSARLLFLIKELQALKPTIPPVNVPGRIQKIYNLIVRVHNQGGLGFDNHADLKLAMDELIELGGVDKP